MNSKALNKEILKATYENCKVTFSSILYIFAYYLLLLLILSTEFGIANIYFFFLLFKPLLVGFAKIRPNKIKFGREVLAEKSGELVGEVHYWQEPGIKSQRN
jgi:hypothetical protein